MELSTTSLLNRLANDTDFKICGRLKGAGCCNQKLLIQKSSDATFEDDMAVASHRLSFYDEFHKYGDVDQLLSISKKTLFSGTATGPLSYEAEIKFVFSWSGFQTSIVFPGEWPEIQLKRKRAMAYWPKYLIFQEQNGQDVEVGSFTRGSQMCGRDKHFVKLTMYKSKLPKEFAPLLMAAYLMEAQLRARFVTWILFPIALFGFLLNYIDINITDLIITGSFLGLVLLLAIVCITFLQS